jgi:hypothetical protein
VGIGGLRIGSRPLDHILAAIWVIPYEKRWSGEVDIRSIKSTMKMDVPRCKSPEMIRNEIWAHLVTTSRRKAQPESLKMVLR